MTEPRIPGALLVCGYSRFPARIAAGLTAGFWYASPATHVGYELIGAGMLILAGDGRGLPMDYDELERWTRGIRAGDEITQGRAVMFTGFLRSGWWSDRRRTVRDNRCRGRGSRS
jgi:hypothetical protein